MYRLPFDCFQPEWTAFLRTLGQTLERSPHCTHPLTTLDDMEQREGDPLSTGVGGPPTAAQQVSVWGLVVCMEPYLHPAGGTM